MGMSSSALSSPSTASDLEEDDPYAYLEEVESSASLEFARLANEKCLSSLGDPSESSTIYDRVLESLDSDDRIPHVRMLGYDAEDGEMLLYNFWKDGKNPKGLWRRTTLTSYQTSTPEWTTVLDLDALAKSEDTSWVWKGFAPLPRALDPQSGLQPGIPGTGRTTRALLFLSRGGADATVVREFDLLSETFVDPQSEGFTIDEAKNRASYKSRNVLYVGSNLGENSLTNSGYPRTVREWSRGTLLKDAPVVFEGEVTDVSDGASLYDQRHRGGNMYELRQRSVTFYESRVWARRLDYNSDGEEVDGEEESPVELAIPRDCSVSFFGRWMMLSLRSDWKPEDSGAVEEGVTYPSGSLIYVDAEAFLARSRAVEEAGASVPSAPKMEYRVLFEPTATTAYEGYSATKNYIILYILDDVKSKFEFYKLGEDGGPFAPAGGDGGSGKIRAANAGGIDPSGNTDLFWLTTSSYTQPSTLYLADASKAGTVGGVEEEGGGDQEDAYVVSKLKSLPDQYDAAGLDVRQCFATSKDGTRVPYFIVSKKDMVLDGSTPTLLYGYGGFEISLGPKYIATTGIAWLERGGAYVEANIRGGGEYGPSWHQSALKENRNKSYEDFIAVAKHLVSTNVCTPKTLACRGGSNGGLLTGNMLTQAPDLFGAIHVAVPLLDMRRFHKLLAGASWMAEYGDPDTEDWEDYLKGYSPYHNIDGERASYPPVLFTTSTRDDRVHPAHARKMVAKLWDLGKDKDWPVHYYENIEGGHGGAADSKQSAFMTSLAHDFMWNALTSDRDE